MKPSMFIYYLTLLGFFTACTQPDEVQITEQYKPIISRITDEERVCLYVEAAYDLFVSTETVLDDWFHPDLGSLLALTNPTQGQLDQIDGYVNAGLADMFTASEDFETAYNGISSLTITEEDFYEYASACENNFFGC